MSVSSPPPGASDAEGKADGDAVGGGATETGCVVGGCADGPAQPLNKRAVHNHATIDLVLTKIPLILETVQFA